MLHLGSARARLRLAAAPFWLFAFSCAVADAEPLRFQLENGIVARVHGPAEILANRCERRGGQLLFVPKRAIAYQFVTDIDDPAIANRGDGIFYSMPVEDVVAALRSVRLTEMNLEIDVFVLPYPRREVMDSSARDDMIFLSPGVRPVSEHAVHFTVAHEVGHVFQYRWLPDSDLDGWDEYHRTRGTTDASLYRADGAHRNRPHEIFAEDFRFLFGGALATYSGSIENDALPLPNAVLGLEAFVRALTSRRAPVALADITALPNPFNPATSIRVRFLSERAAASLARVSIYDTAGRNIRDLYEGVPSAQTLDLAWDGRRNAGSRAASGIYFARLEHAGESITTKLVLVE
jgi:flagellar hook capping protein FlgD